MILRICFSLALLSTTTLADDAPDCNNQVDQNTMTQCANIDFEKADAELNSVWRTAKKSAADNDAEQPDDLKGLSEALLKTQRAWISYRDGQCEVAGFAFRGGSIEPTMVAQCLADMTKARTKELQDFIDGPEQ